MDSHQMVKDLKAGKKVAFDQLYEEYHLQLYRTAYLILGNAHDAEDVLQETFVSAYTNIGQLKDEKKLKPWLYSILKHQAYEKGKKRNREWPDENVLVKIDISHGGDDSEDQFALQDEIQRSLMKLKPGLREVLILFYYNELTIKEIAQVCGIFQGTVKSRLYRGRRELKKELEKFDMEKISFGKEEKI